MQVIYCEYMKKTYINTNEQFDEDIKKLQEMNPGFNKTTLIRLAVRFSAKNNLVIWKNKQLALMIILKIT